MFVTEKLNVIPYLLMGKVWPESVRKKLNQEYMNLEATLVRSKVLRGFSKSNLIYLIQEHINSQSNELAYLFVPFIFANLNKKIIYTTPATNIVLAILNKYYQVDSKPKVIIENVLDDLNLYIDLSNAQYNDEDFFYTSLIKALCRTDISTIFLLTKCNVDQEKLNQLSVFLKVNIFVISNIDQQEILNGQAINMHQLLFKGKDKIYIELCSLFSQLNAELLEKVDSLNFTRTKNLIEDMFYSEHIYEKLSVYAEYVQTQNRQHTIHQKI